MTSCRKPGVDAESGRDGTEAVDFVLIGTIPTHVFFGGLVESDALRSAVMDWNSVRTTDPNGASDDDSALSREAGTDWSTTRDPGPGRVTVSTRDLTQIRTIAEACARIAQRADRPQDGQALRDVVARFDQVAGPLEDHYGQVEQWEALILGRS